MPTEVNRAAGYESNSNVRYIFFKMRDTG